MCLEHEAQKECASARDLLKAVRKGSFVLATYALSDVLPILSKLSLILQRQALNYADVGPVVKATVNAISSLESNPGQHLSGLMEKRQEDTIEVSSTSGTSVTVRVSDHTLQQFLQSFWEFLHALVENINYRFPSIPILDALAVLDPRNLPPVIRLAGYGDPQIRILTNHFGQPAFKEPGIIKKEEAMSEWLLCRHLMSSTFRGQTMEEFGCYAVFSPRCISPAITSAGLLLLAIGLVIPVTNVGCERGFSCQNRRVTKLRNRLMEEKIDSLMRTFHRII